MKIERNADVITGSEDLEQLYTFRNFPVFMGCTTAPQATDAVADMSFGISRSSGMIQLNPLLPLDVLYPEAHGAGCVGASWAAHHQAFADFIGKYNPSSVLEIGGAHGILATNYQAKERLPWTILEPNPTPIKECEANIIKGFFDENFRFAGDVDAIVHSHVFEHMYAPELFVKHLSDFLKPGKKLIFSVPNMRVMLERKYTNCLNFEHTIYLSEDYIEYLLAKYGFRVLERQYFLDDHSVFYSAIRDIETESTELPVNLYRINKKLYFEYLQFHEKLVAEINKQLIKIENSRTFLFGAHVQAQYLIGFGLNLDKIEAILDNDINKQGKRLFGTNKLVAEPSILGGLESPTVILRAGTFTNEVVAQIKSINSTTLFIL
jgi:SAM-dependent methyltransferase